MICSTSFWLEEKIRPTQSKKTGKAAAYGRTGRCDRSDTQAVRITPRPDDRYPDWVASDDLCLD